MNFALALTLASIAALAMWRIGRQRPGLVLLQPIAAALLYLTLLPPPSEQRAGTLVIATAATTAKQVLAHRSEGPVLALPEAPPLPEVEAVPDLATALRRYPTLARVQVLGAGLGARDREAVAGRALAFEAAPLPPGLVELSAPTQITIGARWTVSGRVNAPAGTRVELHDPSGHLLLATPSDAQGRFALSALAPTEGRMAYRLDVIATKGARETFELPMQVQEGRKAQIWLLSGGVNAELKYLQRWARDAGLNLRSQVSLGSGLRVGDALPTLDAQNLAKIDLLVLDERAWRDLGPARRRVLRDAVAQGLGLMLRITGPIKAAERTELRESGFEIGNDEGSIESNLPGLDAPSLLRQPLRVSARDGLALLTDSKGRALGLWRAQGRGRMGLWWLGESYRLVLAGRNAEYSRLWSEAFSTLARADAAPAPSLMTRDPRPQQRAIVCGLQAAAQLTDSAGRRDTLLPDPASGDCAAWWPAQAGWHRLRSGEATRDVYVRRQDEAPGLLAQEQRDATLALVSPGAADAKLRQSVPGPRWPWFLAWLLVAGLGWALERRKPSVNQDEISRSADSISSRRG